MSVDLGRVERIAGGSFDAGDLEFLVGVDPTPGIVRLLLTAWRSGRNPCPEHFAVVNAGVCLAVRLGDPALFDELLDGILVVDTPPPAPPPPAIPAGPVPEPSFAEVMRLVERTRFGFDRCRKALLQSAGDFEDAAVSLGARRRRPRPLREAGARMLAPRRQELAFGRPDASRPAVVGGLPVLAGGEMLLHQVRALVAWAPEACERAGLLRSAVTHVTIHSRAQYGRWDEDDDYPADLESLARFPNLRSLDIDGANPLVGLDALDRMNRLEFLELERCRVPAQGWRAATPWIDPGTGVIHRIGTYGPELRLGDLAKLERLPRWRSLTIRGGVNWELTMHL